LPIISEPFFRILLPFPVPRLDDPVREQDGGVSCKIIKSRSISPGILGKGALPEKAIRT
jgi:hypothetical protein